jgi:membrane protein DedA with SNARE-associated domain
VGQLEIFAEWLVDVVQWAGYIGVFVATFLESTFVPIPSEVTMIPVGVLVQSGDMNLIIVIAISVIGAVSGALFNYYIAYHYGRRFLYNYGKYLFFNHDKMEKLDKFFASHGEISTFTGRLVPGLRHIIAFPAGLAHMNLKKFCIYTGAGGGIWMTTLIMVGYIIGGNKEVMHKYATYISLGAVAGVILLIGFYIWHQRRKNGPQEGKDNQ